MAQQYAQLLVHADLLCKLPGYIQGCFTLQGQCQGVTGPGVNAALRSAGQSQHNAAVVSVIHQPGDHDTLYLAACSLQRLQILNIPHKCPTDWKQIRSIAIVQVK